MTHQQSAAFATTMNEAAMWGLQRLPRGQRLVATIATLLVSYILYHVAPKMVFRSTAAAWTIRLLQLGIRHVSRVYRRFQRFISMTISIGLVLVALSYLWFSGDTVLDCLHTLYLCGPLVLSIWLLRAVLGATSTTLSHLVDMTVTVLTYPWVQWVVLVAWLIWTLGRDVYGMVLAAFVVAAPGPGQQHEHQD